MPRTRTIDPSSDSCAGADILNGPLKAKQINIFKGLAAHPPVLEAFLGFAGGAKAGSLTDAEHEIIALTCGEQRSCGYCVAAHTMVAAGTGLDEETCLGIRRGTANDDRHQALLDFTVSMLETHGHVPDETLAAFKAAGFGDDAAIEVVASIAVNTFTNYFNGVHDTEIDFPVPATV